MIDDAEALVVARELKELLPDFSEKMTDLIAEVRRLRAEVKTSEDIARNNDTSYCIVRDALESERAKYREAMRGSIVLARSVALRARTEALEEAVGACVSVAEEYPQGGTVENVVSLVLSKAMERIRALIPGGK